MLGGMEPSWSRYLEGARRHLALRAEAHRREAAHRQEELLLQARAAARLLAERFGAERVVLFGSVARGRADARSDLDLAVGGLPATDAVPALAALLEVAPGAVDLVRLEDASPALLSKIHSQGLVLHGPTHP